MLITLEYATLTVTVNSNDPQSEVEALLICGRVINTCFNELHWEKPNIKLKVNPLCPKCFQRMTEGNPDDSFFHCEKCGITAKKEKAKT